MKKAYNIQESDTIGTIPTKTENKDIEIIKFVIIFIKLG